MSIVMRIAAIALCLSIAGAGFPAQAKAACPMSMGEQARPAASATPVGPVDCHKPSGQASGKGCCDDMACAAKCSTLGGGFSMDMPGSGGRMSRLGDRARLARPDDAPPASLSPNSQERPPRLLA